MPRFRRRRKGEWLGALTSTSVSGDTSGAVDLISDTTIAKYTRARLERLVGHLSIVPGYDASTAGAQTTLLRMGLICEQKDASADPADVDELAHDWLWTGQLLIGVGVYRNPLWDSDSNTTSIDNDDTARPGPGALIPYFPISIVGNKRIFKPGCELHFCYNNDELSGTAQNTQIYGMWRMLIVEAD